MSLVIVRRCDSYDAAAVGAAVRAVVDDLGGIKRFVKPGDKVLLKPNLLAARSPGARVTTDPQVVAAVARLVLEAGGRPLIGDSPALEPFQRVARKTGMAEVAVHLGIELQPLRRSLPVELPEGSTFRRLEIAAEVLEADVVINLPKLKTHAQMLLTLGVKNLYGTIIAQRKAEWHYMVGADRDAFAALHLDIYRLVRPALTIVDGIWAMEGHGPANGTPRHLGVVVGATEAVALDVSLCRLLGVPPRAFPLYRAARARNLPGLEPDEVSLAGDGLGYFPLNDFKTPALDSLGVLPRGFNWLAQRYLVSKPVHFAKQCKACGQCVEICPARAIKLEGTELTFDYQACIRCFCCQEVCPHDAIGFKRGLLVRTLNLLQR